MVVACVLHRQLETIKSVVFTDMKQSNLLELRKRQNAYVGHRGYVNVKEILSFRTV